MTVSVQTPLKPYLANGVTTTFAYPFQIFDTTTLKVYVAGVLQTTGYSVTGVGSPTGGNVVFAVAPANGARVLVYRSTSPDRPADYADDLLVDSLNRDFDRLWLAFQEVVSGARGAGSSIRVSDGESLDVLPAASARALRLLGFDSNGAPALVPVTDASGSTSAAFVVYVAPGASASRSQSAINDDTRWITNYGADPNGIGPTATTAAIIAAIDQLVAGPGRGTVWAPAGVFVYESEIQVPPYINIRSAGKGATTFRSTNANARFNFIDGSADGRGGLSGGFTLDGNDVGTRLLRLGYAVERSFSDINVVHAFTDNILLEGTQNAKFYSVDSQECRGTCLTVDKGAGNNYWSGGEINRAGAWNIKFQHTEDPPTVGDSGGFPEPTNNTFKGMVIERQGWDGAIADPDTGSGLIYHGAGKFNTFSGSSFALPGLDSTLKSLVMVEKAGTQQSIGLTFNDAFWSGTASRTTAIEVRANCNVVLGGRQNFENHLNALAVADTASVTGDWEPTIGGVTNYFANQGGGTQPQQNLLLSNKRNRQAFLTPLDFVAQTFQVPGEAAARTETFPGFLRFGDGGTTANIQAGFVELYGVDGVSFTNTLAPTSFVARFGPVDMEVRNTIPSASVPNGSIGVNTAGAPGLTHYMRSGGTYYAIPHQIQGTFDPVLTFGSASTGITYTSRSGTYTRIGDRVFFDATFVLSSKGSATGVCNVGGMPFTPAAATSSISAWMTSITSGTGDTMLQALMVNGATAVRLDKIVAGVTSRLTEADFTDTTQLTISGFYKV